MSTVSRRPDDAALVNFLAGKLSPSGMEKVVAYLNAHPEVLAELAEKRGRNVVDRDLQTLAQTFQDQPQIQSLVVQFHASQAIATQTDAGIPSAEHGTEAGQGETDENPLAFLAPAKGPDELGRLGDYRILRKLGEGGMGMVFEAEDLKLKRRVAMKVMKPKIAEKTEHRQRFLREAQVAAQVEHDHICPIYQIGEENKVPFIAMPFLKGEPLNVRLKRERVFPLSESVRIARELAEGLKAAHDANLIHRDIKPANIWLENMAGRASRVRILDFGLARLQTDEVHLTNSGTIVGTPAYMSPEQARAKALDGRTDLFSLGVVLFEMTTGQRPFSGTDTISILTALAADDPTPPEKINPQIPRELSRLILQLLAKNPDHRPANAQTVVIELKRIEMQLTMPIVEALPIAQANPNTANPWQDIDVEDESGQSNSIPMASIPETKPTPKKGSLKWVLIGLGLLFPLLLILGAVFYISTDNGTIEVQTTDKNVKIILEDAGGKITILDPQSKQQWVVNTGKYTIKLDDNPDGLEIDLPTDRVFEMKRGGKMVVSLRKTDKVVVGKDPKEKDKLTDPDRKAAEWILSVLGHVHIGPQKTRIERLSDLPKTPFSLTVADLSEIKNVRDEQLAVFKGCKDITELFLTSNNLSDRGIESFADCKKLEYLLLYNTKITDKGLAFFSDCTKLKHLKIISSTINGEGFVHFAKCSQLESIYLTGEKLRDNSLTHFKNCDRLYGFHLGGKQITNEALKSLEVDKKEHTIEIRLEDTSVTDEGLSLFKHLSKLESLILSGTPISDEGISKFRGCEQLASVDLSNTMISDKSLEVLQTCPKLVKLNLKGTKITPAGIAELKKALPKCNIEHDEAPQGALEFDGKNSRVEIPTLKMDPKTYPSFTFEAWVKPDPNGNRQLPNQKPVLVGTQGFGLLLHIQQTKDDRKIHHYQFEAKSAPGVGQAVAQHPDGFVHVAGVYDGERCHLYYQGKLLVSHKQEFKEPYAKTPIEIEIGRHFLGQIRAVRITNGVRYTKDFLPEKQLTADKESVALYNFTDKEGDKVTDLSDKNHHGKRVDAKWITTAMDPDRKAAEWVLSVGGKVMVNQDGTQLSKLEELPKNGYTLTGISLSGDKITDDDFKVFSGCTQLEVIHLSGLKINGAGLEHFAQSKRIKSFTYQYHSGPKKCDFSGLAQLNFEMLDQVEFFCTTLNDTDLNHFQKCSKLRYISLTRTGVSGKVLQKFVTNPALEVLDIRENSLITDEDLKVVEHWKNLKDIRLSQTAVTGECIPHLLKCPNLEIIGFSLTPIFDKNLDQLKDFQKLRILQFDAREITDEGLKSLEKFKLIQLTLSGSKITDNGLESIGKNTELVTLFLANTKITDEGLKHLKQPRKWWILDLSGTNISDKGLQHIQTSFSGDLHLSNTKISDEAIPILKTWTNLGGLKIKGTKITPAGIAELKKALPKCNIEHDELPKK